MVRDIDLNSNEWCELVFEGKNQKYGAYYLRKTSTKRHVRAMLIVLILGVLVVVLPTLLNAVMPKKDITDEIGAVELSNLDIKQEIPEENKIKQLEEVPPPPLLKETVKFTPPVIKKDEDVKEENEMKTQQELTDNKAAISVADVKGVKEGGVDIADLKEHKVVVQETEEKPFVNVEQMPTFPGGESELMKYLNDKIKYPVVAAEQGIQGLVILRFVVSKTGDISDVQVLRSLDPSCDKEAQRVVKSMPKWTPGRQNGNAVAVYYTLPVRFRLQQ